MIDQIIDCVAWKKDKIKNNNSESFHIGQNFQ